MSFFKVTYKTTKSARKVMSWIRLADSLETATSSAKDALNNEFYGEAVLVCVRPLTSEETETVRAGWNV